MEYPKTFKQIVADSDCPDFIGWGNPNAKILLLHNDPVINISKKPTSRRYTPEITNNKRDWENNIANNTGFDEIFDNYSTTRLCGNPLYPYCWQKYQLKRQKSGISSDEYTNLKCYQSQKLINEIFHKDSDRNANLDFYKYCFISNVSEKSARYYRLANPLEAHKTYVCNRQKFLLKDFFKQFPVIIISPYLAIYRYPNNYDKYIHDTFGVERVEKIDVRRCWDYLWVKDVYQNNNKLLISEYYYSDFDLTVIARHIHTFQEEKGIDLMPDSF